MHWAMTLDRPLCDAALYRYFDSDYHCCLMFLSNMWSGTKHDNSRLPIILAGGLGGTLKTGRVLNYRDKDDANRKLCSLYLSVMDRMGVKQSRFGDAEAPLAGL